MNDTSAYVLIRASEIAAENQITHAFSSYESLLSVDKGEHQFPQRCNA